LFETKRGDQKIKSIPQVNRESRILCSVCIATYKRPQLLENLLRSLINQLLPDTVDIEIIVVDNDINKSAEIVVRRFQHASHFHFFYFHQPVKNISMTRNVGVKKSSGEYILFIDDDEVASTRWVSHLLNTLKIYNADGVFGKVEPEFNPQTPKWMQHGEFFFHPVLATGDRARIKYTTNCIIKASLLRKLQQPFDPRYGLTGGEDVDLFDRLEEQGASFVYSVEALTWEYLPPTRTRLSYLFLRSLSMGYGHTLRMIIDAG
jgi:succinoglycan biosynthesis protein ExoM